jgi:hypothetical protein
VVVVAPLLPKVECRIGADSPVSTSLYWFDKLDHRLLLGRDNVVSERALRAGFGNLHRAISGASA